MEQILFNLALMHVTNFCKDNNIDCSDTYLTKRQRQFTYDLKQFAAPNKIVASVTFHKFAVWDKKHKTVLKSLQLEILEFGTAAEIICQDQFGRKYIHSLSFEVKEI